MWPHGLQMLFIPDPYLLVQVMYGLAENGNGIVVIITGMRGPGRDPKRAIPGNQDIGKTAKKVTVGIKAAGNKYY
jgi:hypothetical protein